MSSRFPHLSDNMFPGIATVNPYKFAQKFDYTRWDEGATIKLCNVNFDSDGSNVVKFDDDAARDRYFDTIEGDSITLDSGARVLPDGHIKLPVPFDVAMGYNYLVVDFKTATSDQYPIDYEKQGSVKRFHFFILDVQYSAPSTTDFILKLDDWTTFINRVDIDYMMLERGHAGVAATDAERFLADPAHNTRYLLADDFTFGEPVFTNALLVTQINQGVQYMLIATTVPLRNLLALGRVEVASASDPGYFTQSGRDGYQTGVNGFDIAGGGLDYSNLNLSTEIGTSVTNNTPNNISVFAIRADDAYNGGFFSALVEQIPQFMQTIQAIFILGDSLVNVSEISSDFLIRNSMTWRELAATGKTWDELHDSNHTYAEIDANAAVYFGEPHGFTIYSVAPANETVEFPGRLTKKLFGYPDEYKDLAKLYTYPYAALEFTRADGSSIDIKVERTTNIKYSQRISIAYPYLHYSALFSGIDGAGDMSSYTWVNILGQETSAEMPVNSFKEFMYDYEIPAFALYMNGYDSYRLHNYNTNNTVKRIEALRDYENAARSMNTSYENSVDSAEKAYGNADRSIGTARANALRGAQASLDNALASNATAQANANASAATGYDNSVRAADTGLANTTAAADTAQANANASAATGYANATASNETAYLNSRDSAQTGLDNANASADAGFANSSANAEVSKDNSLRSADTSYTGVSNNTIVSRAGTELTNAISEARMHNNSYYTAENTHNNQRTVYLGTTWDTQFSDQAFLTKESEAAMTGIVSAAAHAITGGAGQLLDAAVSKNDTKSAANIANFVVNEGVNDVAAVINYSIAFSSKQDIVTGQKEVARLKMHQGTGAANQNFINQLDAARQNVNILTDLQSTLTANSINLALTNAGNTKATAVKNAEETKNVDISNAQRSRDTSKANAQRSRDTAVANALRSQETADANAERNRGTIVSNAANTRNTSVANAQRSRDTDVANAAATRDTANANAQRSRDTGDANARRSFDASVSNTRDTASTDWANATRDRDLSIANARATRDTALANAQRSLKATGDLARAGYLDHRLDAPIQIGKRSGDPVADENKLRALQFRVKTQLPDEIAQAGDLFLRFGYAMNQVWRFDGFNVMPHFSYWKALDLWLTGGTGVLESSQEHIKRMLLNGVTVWKNPDEIGKVSIYGNK